MSVSHNFAFPEQHRLLLFLSGLLRKNIPPQDYHRLPASNLLAHQPDIQYIKFLVQPMSPIPQYNH